MLYPTFSKYNSIKMQCYFLFKQQYLLHKIRAISCSMMSLLSKMIVYYSCS